MLAFPSLRTPSPCNPQYLIFAPFPHKIVSCAIATTPPPHQRSQNAASSTTNVQGLRPANHKSMLCKTETVVTPLTQSENHLKTFQTNMYVVLLLLDDINKPQPDLLKHAHMQPTIPVLTKENNCCDKFLRIYV